MSGMRLVEFLIALLEAHAQTLQRLAALFGEDLLVTRKGAIRAGAGEMGIIPGSMASPASGTLPLKPP